MIFSTDRCPLCDKQLRMEVIEVTSGKVHIRYYCETKEQTRDDTNMVLISKSHYDNECFPKGSSLASMIIPPYVIFHSQSNNMTSVYEIACFMESSRKLIFRTKLLDLDYAQPHVVLSKLKLLVTFS